MLSSLPENHNSCLMGLPCSERCSCLCSLHERTSFSRPGSLLGFLHLLPLLPPSTGVRDSVCFALRLMGGRDIQPDIPRLRALEHGFYKVNTDVVVPLECWVCEA
ncbi:hypothetical protein QYF36_019320 [Acer negundo]|nr:hypothetical protein QYF36_019320 [Acer negundo]